MNEITRIGNTSAYGETSRSDLRRALSCICYQAGDDSTPVRLVEQHPLCPVHGDERDTSIDRVRLTDAGSLIAQELERRLARVGSVIPPYVIKPQELSRGQTPLTRAEWIFVYGIWFAFGVAATWWLLSRLVR